MTRKSIIGSKRVVQAIRKADALPRNEKSNYPSNSQPPSGGGGGRVLFASIVSSVDANNYVASIYKTSDLSDTPTTDKTVYVMTISQTLKNDSVIPVQTTKIAGVDYECIQQLGLLGEA